MVSRRLVGKAGYRGGVRYLLALLVHDLERQTSLASTTPLHHFAHCFPLLPLLTFAGTLQPFY